MAHFARDTIILLVPILQSNGWLRTNNNWTICNWNNTSGCMYINPFHTVWISHICLLKFHHPDNEKEAYQWCKEWFPVNFTVPDQWSIILAPGWFWLCGTNASKSWPPQWRGTCTITCLVPYACKLKKITSTFLYNHYPVGNKHVVINPLVKKMTTFHQFMYAFFPSLSIDELQRAIVNISAMPQDCPKCYRRCLKKVCNQKLVHFHN